MTSTPQPPEPAPAGPPEQTWTMGAAAAYLNAGGVDFGISARDVRRMADDPGNQITATSRGGPGSWRRAAASTVRAERARLLRDLGRRDPEWPEPTQGQAGGQGQPAG